MPDRGDNNEQHRRTGPSSHRHSTHRAGPWPGARYTLTIGTNIARAESDPSAVPHTGIRAGEMIGHRLWWSFVINGEPVLTSLAHPLVWVPGRPVYGNVDEVISSYHQILGGVYSYLTSAGLAHELLYWPRVAPGRALVAGTIKMWGEVVEHREGYRAEYAKVHSLRAVVYGEADLEALRRRYNVPGR